jgi:hypothetical protein
MRASPWRCITGILTDADATWAATLEHGDASDLSDTAAVTAADLIGTLAGEGFTFADDTECRKVGYRGRKRYLRLTITGTGNTGNLFLAGMAVLGHARNKPAPALT